jgi:hypothetical protein
MVFTNLSREEIERYIFLLIELKILVIDSNVCVLGLYHFTEVDVQF